MTLKELLKFITDEDKRLKKYHHYCKDNEKTILAQTIKISEELGELCDEVLSFSNMQRKDKLEKHNDESLAEEFADVLITTLLLAKNMNVDIEKALERKIIKINKRHGKKKDLHNLQQTKN